MASVGKYIIISAALLFAPNFGTAAEINVPQILQERLTKDQKQLLITKSKKLPPLGVKTVPPECSTDPTPCMLQIWINAVLEGKYDRVTVKGALSARNLRHIDISLQPGEIKKNALPEKIKLKKFSVPNCTSSDKTIDEGIDLTDEEGTTVTIAKNVVTGTEVKVDVKIYMVGVGAGENTNVTLSESKATNFKSAERRTAKINEKVKPFTRLNVLIKKRLSTDAMPIKGNIEVDAEVFLTTWVHDNPPFEMSMGKLSDLYTRDQRIFFAEGDIWNVKSEQLEIIYSEEKLDASNPDHCPALVLKPDNKQLIIEPVSKVQDILSAIVPEFKLQEEKVSLSDCKSNCLEFSSECNQECPMESPEGPACHAMCQVLYDRCVAKCEAESKSKSFTPMQFRK